VEKPEGKRLLGRPRRRWEDNIEIILKIGWNGVVWFDLAQDTSGGSCERGDELWCCVKCEGLVDRLTNCQLLKKVSGALACRC
jgi:hypothetical protein